MTIQDVQGSEITDKQLNPLSYPFNQLTNMQFQLKLAIASLLARLCLGQGVVFNPNVALGKFASQSSSTIHPADRAVNNNTDGNFYEVDENGNYVYTESGELVETGNCASTFFQVCCQIIFNSCNVLMQLTCFR